MRYAHSGNDVVVESYKPLFYVSPMSYEPIYGLMIIGKSPVHRAFALRAVDNFFAQTYPAKKLIVVNDGEYRLSEIYGNTLTEIHLKQKFSLGELRNISLEQVSEGALWLQWDDDDWRHPELMARQYAVLQRERAEACVLTRQVQFALTQNSAWVEHREIIEGTIMARSNALRYKPIGKEEDRLFFFEYIRQCKVVKWENPPRYYIRLIHGHNTWDAAHFRLSERAPGAWDVGTAARSVLEKVAREYAFLKAS